MENFAKAKRIRIYISNTDKFKHEPLFEVITYAAKHYGIIGASVFRGFMGFGSTNQISNTRFWEVTEKIPIVVEIIDSEEKISNFVEKIIPYFDKVKYGCLITQEDVQIVLNKQGTIKEDEI